MIDDIAAGEFDYVIVGGGSAGCVLAARLSENPSTTVCLIEAGGPDSHPLIHLPIGFALLTEHRRLNWRFITAPQPHLNNRLCYQPRGRVLGGSSSINAMVYTRGAPSDYDGWAANGADGWAFADNLPYFKKAEDQARGADAFHGVGGPLTVSDLRYKNPVSARFLSACAELQWPSTDDFNGASPEGVGWYQVTQRDGKRCSAARAYLEPARARPNLAILTRAVAARVTIEERRARAVEVLIDGERKNVRARREIILSAGAFQSPQILMLSGVGPGAHLRANGVEVIVDRAEVGANLQDHLDYTILRRSPDPNAIGLNFGTLRALAPALWRHWRRGDGFLSTNLAEAGGFLKTDPALAEPDIQLHFVPGLVDDHGRKHHLGAGFSCHVCALRPLSRGSVRLQGPDAQTAPLIDPNYLSAPEDLSTLMRGARAVLRIFDAPALAPITGEQIYLPADPDDRAIEADIRARADTIYHPVGTCRMGSDEAAPLDPSLRVRGVDRLRVIDASVMPRLIGANTNAPTIMIAEKGADLLKSA